jgi:hypothetical protein
MSYIFDIRNKTNFVAMFKRKIFHKMGVAPFIFLIYFYLMVYFGLCLIFTSSNTLKYFPNRHLSGRVSEELSAKD